MRAHAAVCVAVPPARRGHTPGTAEKHGMAVRLFVGNLPYDVTEAELRALVPTALSLYGHNIRTRLPTGVYASYHRPALACLLFPYHRYASAIGTGKAVGER